MAYTIYIFYFVCWFLIGLLHVGWILIGLLHVSWILSGLLHFCWILIGPLHVAGPWLVHYMFADSWLARLSGFRRFPSKGGKALWYCEGFARVSWCHKHKRLQDTAIITTTSTRGTLRIGETQPLLTAHPLEGVTIINSCEWWVKEHPLPPYQY